ncbi:MAG: Si-specific NAD(P)(+) transhydrogenase [Planctomycetota bacterium]
MKSYDLICIGCGPAGEKAATQASYFRHRVAIVEFEARPGGAIVNTGTVPSKALRETALRCSARRRRPLPGSEFRLDRSLSVTQFMAQMHLVEQQEHDRLEASIDRHGIEVYRGHGRLTDDHTVCIEHVDGTSQTITGQYILIATGSRPSRPDHICFEHPSVIDADGVLQLDRIPKSMAIVGGGVIGCEYASIFAEIGVAVTLIHPKADVLPFIDHECRNHLVRRMRDNGVIFRLNTSVAKVTPRSDATVEIGCRGGDRIETDMLLWAAGRQANSDHLGLEQVGVEMNDRGCIKVNEQYRTNVPSIYAAGDVIGFPALAATSVEQGRIAACDMFQIEFKKALAALMPIDIHTIPAVSAVGLTERDAMEAGRDIVIGRALNRLNARGRTLGGDSGLLKCIFDRSTRALIGATVVGESATELVHLAQLAIVNGSGIDDLVNCCFNHPSLTELYKYATFNALQSIAAVEHRPDELGGLARVA